MTDDTPKAGILLCVFVGTLYFMRCVWNWTDDWPEEEPEEIVWDWGTSELLDYDSDIESGTVTTLNWDWGPHCNVNLLDELGTFETNCTCQEMWDEMLEGHDIVLAYLLACRHHPQWNNTYTD